MLELTTLLRGEHIQPLKADPLGPQNALMLSSKRTTSTVVTSIDTRKEKWLRAT